MKTETRTTTVIGTDIQAAEKRHAVASGALAKLEVRRKDLLVTGSDTELDTHETEAARMRRDVERAEAQLTALRAEFIQAEAAEKVDRLNALFEQAQKAASIGVTLIENDYARHASAIADILEQLTAINDLIGRAEAALRAAEDPRRIPRPNWTARSEPVTVVPARRERVRIDEPKVLVAGKEVGNYEVERASHFKEINEPERKTGGRVQPDLDETVELPGVAWGKTMWSKYLPDRPALRKRFPELLAKAGVT